MYVVHIRRVVKTSRKQNITIDFIYILKTPGFNNSEVVKCECIEWFVTLLNMPLLQPQIYYSSEKGYNEIKPL